MTPMMTRMNQVADVPRCAAPDLAASSAARSRCWRPVEQGTAARAAGPIAAVHMVVGLADAETARRHRTGSCARGVSLRCFLSLAFQPKSMPGLLGIAELDCDGFERLPNAARRCRSTAASYIRPPAVPQRRHRPSRSEPRPAGRPPSADRTARDRADRCAAASRLRMARRSLTFCGCSEEKISSAIVSRTPSSSGTRANSQRHIDVRRPHHLDQMPEQAEAGHIGRGADTVRASESPPPRVGL